MPVARGHLDFVIEQHRRRLAVRFEQHEAGGAGRQVDAQAGHWLDHAGGYSPEKQAVLKAQPQARLVIAVGHTPLGMPILPSRNALTTLARLDERVRLGVVALDPELLERAERLLEAPLLQLRVSAAIGGLGDIEDVGPVCGDQRGPGLRRSRQ